MTVDENDPEWARYCMMIAESEYCFTAIDCIIMCLNGDDKPIVPLQRRIDLIDFCFSNATKILEENNLNNEIKKITISYNNIIRNLKQWQKKVDLKNND